MVDEGQPEPEFQRILDIVDPNRDGYVTLQEYMAFMISKETENIQSSEEIESAFRALSKEFRPYVTAEELYAVSISARIGKGNRRLRRGRNGAEEKMYTIILKKRHKKF